MSLNNYSFNLIDAPWIRVTDRSGKASFVGIRALLENAHQYAALSDHSPITVVSTHRLLTAILQDIYRPDMTEDLAEIWEAGAFDSQRIADFCAEFEHRFDLFSEEWPFMQTADEALIPEKRGNGKSVGYLFYEQPAGTAVTHYQHAYDAQHAYCAKCCVQGLLAIPAFASSGGAGIKPSINGVPPIYLIPGGETLFNWLCASLTMPEYQPKVAVSDEIRPWWRRADNIVEKQKVRLQVGYVESLTFAARRVRLHPESSAATCSRCGEITSTVVREMVYQMGESRPKDAAFWFDPFAAYKLPKPDAKATDRPIPVRPVAGKPAWRNYSSFFLPTEKDAKERFQRPSIIDQLEDDELIDALPYSDKLPIPFQAIGLRTDMKAKIFEWEQTGFLLIPHELQNAETALFVRRSLNFAIAGATIIRTTFRKHFGGKTDKSERHKALKDTMVANYWQQLGPSFSQFALDIATTDDQNSRYTTWLHTVETHANASFKQFSEMVGNDAVSLRQRVQGQAHCAASIRKLRKENYQAEEQS